MNKEIYFNYDELKCINDTINKMYNKSFNKSIDSFMEFFLEELRTQIYFDKGNILIINFDALNSAYEVNTFAPLGWKGSDIDIYIKNYFRMDDVIPILLQKEPIAFRNNDIFSLNERKKTQYYREFVQPTLLQTSIDANISIPTDIDKNLIMGFFRDPTKKDFSKKELELVKTYQPHLSNIFANYMAKNELDSDHLMNLFNIFESIGICFLDQSCNVLSFNSAFKRMATIDRKTSMQESELTKKIKQLGLTLINDSGLKKQGPFECRLKNQTFFIEITKDHESPVFKLVALVYSSTETFMLRFSRITETYNLTTRESEILLLMIGKGMASEKIAEELFISNSTVKKHISSAYQKINIKSQKELICLLGFL